MLILDFILGIAIFMLGVTFHWISVRDNICNTERPAPQNLEKQLPEDETHTSILYEALLIGIYGNWIIELIKGNVWFSGMDARSVYNFIIIMTFFATIFSYLSVNRNLTRRLFVASVHFIMLLFLDFQFPQESNNIMFNALGPVIWIYAVVYDKRNKRLREALGI